MNGNRCTKFIRLDDSYIRADRICRLCTNCYDLHDHERLSKDTAMKINVCIGLKVELDGGLPMNTCRQCKTLVDLLYIFRNKCHESDTKLRSALLSSDTRELVLDSELGSSDLLDFSFVSDESINNEKELISSYTDAATEENLDSIPSFNHSIEHRVYFEHRVYSNKKNFTTTENKRLKGDDTLSSLKNSLPNDDAIDLIDEWVEPIINKVFKDLTEDYYDVENLLSFESSQILKYESETINDSNITPELLCESIEGNGCFRFSECSNICDLSPCTQKNQLKEDGKQYLLYEKEETSFSVLVPEDVLGMSSKNGYNMKKISSYTDAATEENLDYIPSFNHSIDHRVYSNNKRHSTDERLNPESSVESLENVATRKRPNSKNTLPKVLRLDETTDHLDPLLEEQTQTFVQNMLEGNIDSGQINTITDEDECLRNTSKHLNFSRSDVKTLKEDKRKLRHIKDFGPYIDKTHMKKIKINNAALWVEKHKQISNKSESEDIQDIGEPLTQTTVTCKEKSLKYVSQGIANNTKNEKECKARNCIQRKRNRKTDNFFCDSCYLNFTSKKTFIKHRTIHYNIKCKHCNKSFRTSRKLSNHIYENHSDISITCIYCPLAFKSYAELNNHLATHKGAKYKCCYCNEMFYEGEMKSHASLHLSTVRVM